MKAKVSSLVSVGWYVSTIPTILMLPSLAVAQLGDLPIVEPVETAPAEAAVPVPPAASLYRVHLAVDGNVPGSVKVQDKLGSLMPVRATVSVFRDGMLLSTTHSNEKGRFQLPGLLPGTYSVIADAGSHMGVFAVQVLPPHRDKNPAVAPVSLTAAAGEGSQDGETSLDLVLSTEADDEPLETPPMETYFAPMMSGGGGGGGGGGGALLGLAGLAGLAGLGGLGGGGAASPATP